jgi:hypothetical protein
MFVDKEEPFNDIIERIPGTWVRSNVLDRALDKISKKSEQWPKSRMYARSPASNISLYKAQASNCIQEPILRKQLTTARFIVFPMLYDFHYSVFVFDHQEDILWYYNPLVSLHQDYVQHASDIKKKLMSAGVTRKIILKPCFDPQQTVPGSCGAYVLAFVFALVCRDAYNNAQINKEEPCREFMTPMLISYCLEALALYEQEIQ